MMRPLMFRAAAVAALAAGLLARPAAAADKTPSAKLLPPTVFAYVSMPDVTQLKQRLNASSFGAMLKDPKLQPSFDQIKEKLGEAGGQIQEKLGVSAGELLKVPSGEVAFAVFDVAGESTGFVLILDYGSSGATLDKLVQKAESSLKDKGATRTAQQFEGTEIVVYETKRAAPGNDDLDVDGDDKKPASATADTVAWFKKDNRFVLGNSAAALEQVLARWDGKHGETFAKNETYTYIAQKTKPADREPAAIWFVDPIGSAQVALSRSQGGPPQLQMVAAFLPTLGLTKLKGIGGSADVATPEYDSVTKMFLYVEQPPSGVLGVFQFPATDLTPPDWVPDSAAAYFGANWDVPAAVQSIKTLVDTFQGPGAFDQLMNRAANNASGPKINPQKDLLDQLTGRINMANFPVTVPRNAPAGQPAVQQPVVFAVGVKDEKKMQDVLAKLAQTQGFPGTTREFQGTTIYDMPGQNGQKVALAAAKGNLFVSTDAARMEEVLRGSGGSPLAKSDAWRKIDEHIPDKASMIGFQDQKDQLRSMYEAARSGQFGQQVEGFDFSKLPPFDDVSKYLRNGGSYAVPDENGALFVSFSLKLTE